MSESLPVAVGGDGHSIHVLHDEEGELPIGDTTVEELRDVRVIQRREDLSFGDEAPVELVGVGAASQQLDRDPASILAIGAFSQVDDAHSAAPELAQQTIGADLPLNAWCAQEWAGQLDGVSIEDGVGADRVPGEARRPRHGASVSSHCAVSQAAR